MNIGITKLNITLLRISVRNIEARISRNSVSYYKIKLVFKSMTIMNGELEIFLVSIIRLSLFRELNLHNKFVEMIFLQLLTNSF